MITYFKNQSDLSNALISVIDKYWALQINEEEFITYLKQVAENNEEMLFKNNGYTTIVKQKLGIKRLNLLEKILKTESGH
ncbi:TIGR04540 family protein [uncultured Tissierella sp.]|uniref:TIGR04540 family protein n=1 Tax=uncultured Tissierella sp. TaxID=448160 RepID=UPI00280566B0|nr:TIGR04540 family protein [uncultured Tissierella sp.]MDU5082836.1 TIGR04540 family protein [Bacillota bacterium]